MEVTCNRCGWVHFSCTRPEAEDNVERFNRYFDSLAPDKQESYYGGRKSSIDRYESCFNCGGPYTDFRESVPGDCPDGCTIQQIIHFTEPKIS